jgi:uncharacterized protein YdeI (YjbR/CyaY-like superfamily)
MPPVVPNPKNIHAFASEAAFETWLSKNHASATELWLKIHKKGSGLATVTYKEALDVALCWGWIDGLKKTFDEKSFLQRFTPRKPKSVWSQINREHIARLVQDGRMTPHGLRHVEDAKADGRWEAAYASGKNMTVPDDLMAAIAARPKALATFETLDKVNIYALAFRTQTKKTAAGRAKAIATIVAMLDAGKTFHPMAKKK